MGAHAAEIGTPASVRAGSEGSFTVEGRLAMADFRGGHRRCWIEVSAGESVPCIFDETQDSVITAALLRNVRVTGELVKSRRKMPDMKIRRIATVDQTPHEQGSIPQLPRRHDIAMLEAEQGAPVLADFDNLFVDVLPEDENVDDFIATIRKWREEG